jgi:hypothetical protein
LSSPGTLSCITPGRALYDLRQAGEQPVDVARREDAQHRLTRLEAAPHRFVEDASHQVGLGPERRGLRSLGFGLALISSSEASGGRSGNLACSGPSKSFLDDAFQDRPRLVGVGGAENRHGVRQSGADDLVSDGALSSAGHGQGFGVLAERGAQPHAGHVVDHSGSPVGKGFCGDRGCLRMADPDRGALTQEAIDVAVILNGLRALGSGRGWHRPALPTSATKALREERLKLEASLDRLSDIVAALEVANPRAGVELMREANAIVTNELVAHERTNETKVYPRLRRSRASDYGLAAVSHVHRELLYLAHLLSRLSEGLSESDADAMTQRDA